MVLRKVGTILQTYLFAVAVQREYPLILLESQTPKFQSLNLESIKLKLNKSLVLTEQIKGLMRH